MKLINMHYRKHEHIINMVLFVKYRCQPSYLITFNHKCEGYFKITIMFCFVLSV